MWSYQMCEDEILQGSGNGHTHSYSNQLVPKNSNVWPRIFLVNTLWTVNQMEMICLKTNIVSFSVQCRVKGKVFCDECWEIDCDKLALQWCTYCGLFVFKKFTYNNIDWSIVSFIPYFCLLVFVILVILVVWFSFRFFLSWPSSLIWKKYLVEQSWEKTS